MPWVNVLDAISPDQVEITMAAPGVEGPATIEDGVAVLEYEWPLGQFGSEPARIRFDLASTLHGRFRLRVLEVETHFAPGVSNASAAAVWNWDEAADPLSLIGFVPGGNDPVTGVEPDEVEREIGLDRVEFEVRPYGGT